MYFHAALTKTFRACVFPVLVIEPVRMVFPEEMELIQDTPSVPSDSQTAESLQSHKPTAWPRSVQCLGSLAESELIAETFRTRMLF